MMSAIEGLAVSTTRWQLYLQETGPLLIVQEAGWASGWVGPKFLPPPAFEPQTIQPAVSHYADRAIPATFEHEENL
jgi:hypothetical protein